MPSKVSIAIAVIIMALLGIYALLGEDGNGAGGRESAAVVPEQSAENGGAVVAEQLNRAAQEGPAEIPLLANATPAPDEVVRAIPKEVVLRFNMHLVPPSRFTIESGADDYGLGDTVLSKDGLTMRRKTNSAAPAGTYRVRYRMCTLPAKCATDYYFFKVE